MRAPPSSRPGAGDLEPEAAVAAEAVEAPLGGKSVDQEDFVAARARDAILKAGYSPTLVVGDGLYGYAENAEYDRLIATCSVRTIPLAWPQQVREGGTVTAPMRGWLGGVAFARISPWPATAPRVAASWRTTCPS